MNDFILVIKSVFINTFECISRMDYIHLLLLLGILLLVLVMVPDILRQAAAGRIKRLPALLAVICASFAGIAGVIASVSGTLVFIPTSAPDNTVQGFVDAYNAMDVEAMGQYMDAEVPFNFLNGLRSDVPLATEDATEQDRAYQKRFMELWKDKLECRAEGSVSVNKTEAVQRLRVRMVDLEALQEQLKPLIQKNIEEMSRTRSKAQVYNKDDTYRAEAVEEAYDKAVETVLARARKNSTMKDVSVDLHMNYVDGEWRIREGEDFFIALAGGVHHPEVYAYNARSEALSEIIYIPKIYTIAEEATMGPKPNPANYGTISPEHPEDLREVLEKAAFLIGDQELFWDENVDFKGDVIHYYLDDSIFFVAWKELYKGHSCCFAEVFVADASQFRRKLSGDTFGASMQKLASTMSQETNAVIAMNGDYYKFRAPGIMVYQRELYRFKPQNLEICFVDSKGNLNFTYAGELTTEEECRQYVKDNDILFSLAFGPVLVADGKVHYTDSYLIGEVNQHYSRSGIGQRGERHYLLMNSNYGYNTKGSTINESADIMFGKGCYNAYALDGGQTAEMVIQHKVFNAIDYSNERQVSDILYFVTAIPEEDAQ